MTSTKLLTTIIFLFVLTSVQSQTILTVTEALDEFVNSTKTIKHQVKKAKRTLRTLTVDYFVNNNPNPDTETYLNQTKKYFAAYKLYSEEALNYATFAEDFDTGIEDINELIDFAYDNIFTTNNHIHNSEKLVESITLGNRREARRLAKNIRANLNSLIELCDEYIALAEQIKLIVNTQFKVRIQLVDAHSGELISEDYPYTLEYFYAKNPETNQVVATTLNSAEGVFVFDTLLEAGTYNFGGVRDPELEYISTETITITNEMINEEGYVIIVLKYFDI